MITEAIDLVGAFYRREDNDTLCIHGDHPAAETVRSMVFQASQQDLGHDFSYEAVKEALFFLAERHPDEIAGEDARHDLVAEFADGQCDIYTHDLISWLASAPVSHVGLCNEANEEYSTTELSEIITNGQHLAYRRAMESVLENWPVAYDEDSETF